MVPEGTNLESFLKTHPDLAEEFGSSPKGATILLQSNTIGVEYETAIREIKENGFYVARAPIDAKLT